MPDSWDGSEVLLSSEKQIIRQSDFSYQITQLFRPFDVRKGIMHRFLGHILAF